ncbi:unnamed protein product, partial [Effrenium voratum]
HGCGSGRRDGHLRQVPLVGPGLSIAAPAEEAELGHSPSNLRRSSGILCWKWTLGECAGALGGSQELQPSGWPSLRWSCGCLRGSLAADLV